MREAHALIRNKPTFGRANLDEAAAAVLVKRVALGDHDQEKCFVPELSMLDFDAKGRFDTVCAYLDQEVVQRHHLLARHPLNLAIVRNAAQERATASALAVAKAIISSARSSRVGLAGGLPENSICLNFQRPSSPKRNCCSMSASCTVTRGLQARLA